VIVHRTVVRLGVRSVFGRWRGVLLLVLPVVLVAVAVLVRALVGQDEQAAETTMYGLGLVVVVPLVALLATSGLLAPEIDDGSIVYLLAKPVPRATIVASKLVVAFGCVLVFAAVPMLVAGFVLVTGRPAFALGFALGALAGGVAYSAVFAWLSVLTRHAVVVGLMYLLIWEGLLGGLMSGVRWLSVNRWSAEVVDHVTGASLVSRLPLIYAVLALVVSVVVFTWRTGTRLRRFNLTGDE